jgi:hypothetical protein
MRKISLAVVVLGACLAWSLSPDTPAIGDGGMTAGGGPAGQTPFAGTFLAVFGGPLEGVRCIVQIHADGTLWHIDQSDYGLGGALDLDSPQVGSWRRTGPFQTTAVTLFFNFDNPSGAPTTVSRATNVADWDVGYNTASGVATLRLYDLSAGEDPLDPEQGTPVPFEIPWTMRRLVP